jgi:hypothetical protein
MKAAAWRQISENQRLWRRANGKAKSIGDRRGVKQANEMKDNGMKAMAMA